MDQSCSCGEGWARNSSGDMHRSFATRECLMSKKGVSIVLNGIVAALVALLCFGCQLVNAADSHDKKPSDSAEYGGPVRGRHALLVGVWDYDRGRGERQDWWNLHSQKDIEVIHQLLHCDYGFAESEITILTKREETTHEAIRTAFERMIADTYEGDVVYFHYSGHGQQIPDPKHEEIDGYNQSLVPSDYISRADGSKNVRNKEIRDWLKKLKEKKPANVTLVFDSCFSGDLTRGGRHLVRGEAWHGPRTTVPATAPIAESATGLVMASSASGPVVLREKGPSGILPRGEADDLGYVVISASRYDQIAQETEDDQGEEMGLLTYALVRAMTEVRPAAIASKGSPQTETTYRDLFERVTDLMTQKNQNQIPVMEGQQDKVVLGGIVRKPQPFVLVNLVADHLVLRAGTLHGVTERSVFALYPPETKDFEHTHPLAMARVGSVSLATATLELTDEFKGKVKPGALDRSRAVEREHVFGDSGLRVYIEDGQGRLPTSVIEKLKKLSVIRQFVGPLDKWAVRIRPRATTEDATAISKSATLPPDIKWLVEREDGSRMAALPEDPHLYAAIRNALEMEARWRAIKSLTNRDEQSPVKVKLRVVPVDVKAKGDEKVAKAEQIGDDKPLERNASGQIVLRDQGHVLFEVRNTGSVKAWITILDLSNDGKIHPIFPPIKSSKNDIPPNGQWIRLPWWSVAKISNPSDRIEIFKVIATNEYIDLSSLVDLNKAKGAVTTQSKLSPLAELLRAATLGQKSAKNNAVNPSFWYTDTVPFVVGPRK